MNLTNRTKTSLAQLFDLIEYQYINIIFGKHSFPATCDNIEDFWNELKDEYKGNKIYESLGDKDKKPKEIIDLILSFLEKYR